MLRCVTVSWGPTGQTTLLLPSCSVDFSSVSLQISCCLDLGSFDVRDELIPVIPQQAEEVPLPVLMPPPKPGPGWLGGASKVRS